MKWEKDSGNPLYERWDLINEDTGRSIACIDHVLGAAGSSTGRKWEYYIDNAPGNFHPFPKGGWTMKTRKAYVTALARLS